jgi:hypothetical protein
LAEVFDDPTHLSSCWLSSNREMRQLDREHADETDAQAEASESEEWSA